MTFPILLLAAASISDASLSAILQRNFHSFLIASMPSGRITSGSMPEAALPAGSLIKPFTALAFGQPFPQLECDGKSCWRIAGHGRLGFTQALAVSCNTYFRVIARQTSPHRLSQILMTFGIEASPDALTEDARLGLGGDLRISPPAVVRAYSELLQRNSDPVIRQILEGLRLAASKGTAKEFRGKVLAKTGTAHCAQDEGDGLVVAAWPAANPRTLVLVRDHRRTGAATARKLAALVGPLWGLP